MKITVTADKGENNTLAVKLTVDKKDVDAAVAKTYKDIARQYNFQGFRRGHAPRPVIDGIIGRQAVLAEATNDLLTEAEPLMLEELDVVPVKQPDYGKDVAPAKEHQDYTVDVTIEVRPEAELDSYEPVAITMPPEEATEAEIDQQIDTLMSYRTTYEDVEEDRAVEPEDHVQATIVSKSNLRQYEGDDRLLDLGQVDEHLRDGIVGMKKGETKDVSWTLEHQHEDGHTHEIEFAATVTVNGIKHPVTPELTEDNVKSDLGFDSIQDLRDAIKEEIEEDKKHSLPELKEDRVVEEVGKRLTLEKVPSDYVDQVFNEIANQFLTQLQRQGMTLDLYLKARNISADDFLADLHQQSEERARQSLALDALAAHQGFDATDEDVRNEFEKAGVEDVDKSIEDFRKQGRLPGIRESIKRTKAVDWLAETAEVTVKDEIAERNAEQEQDEPAGEVAKEAEDAE